MPDTNSLSRRSVLIAVGLMTAGFAGCSGSQEQAPTTTAVTQTTTPPATASPTAAASSTDLDLSEANVVDVTFESEEEGTYRFDVTLHHDDEGEDGYANWWQIETFDRTQLGRRTLLHAHATQPFTRSSSIDIPSDVTCVVVRGHDQTHEYGGQVYLVNMESGNTRAIKQGAEPETFDSSDCPS